MGKQGRPALGRDPYRAYAALAKRLELDSPDYLIAERLAPSADFAGSLAAEVGLGMAQSPGCVVVLLIVLPALVAGFGIAFGVSVVLALVGGVAAAGVLLAWLLPAMGGRPISDPDLNPGPLVGFSDWDVTPDR